MARQKRRKAASGVDTRIAETVAGVGLRIAELRVENGETQAELASRLEVSLKYVQRVERGTNLTISSLVVMAAAFDAEVTALFEPPSFTKVNPGRPVGQRKPKRKPAKPLK